MSMHINAKPGDIAETVLLPGDPLRAKYIAETFLSNAVLVNDVRNMWAYTGYYKDQRVTIFPIGMGVPSAMIYTTELCRDYGCKKLVRPGTCGAYREDIQLGELILAQAVSPVNRLLDYTLPGHFSPIADFDLLVKANTLAKEQGLTVYVGNMVTNDVLSFDDRIAYCKKWLPFGVLGQELEGAGLYTVAAQYGAKAVMMLTVAVNYWREHEQMSNEEKAYGMEVMHRLALDTAID